jgi:hypothetical protein
MGAKLKELVQACLSLDGGCCNDFAVADLVLSLATQARRQYACAKQDGSRLTWYMKTKGGSWANVDANGLWLMIPQVTFDALEKARSDMFAQERKDVGDDIDDALKRNRVRAEAVGCLKSLCKCNRVFKAIERLSIRSQAPALSITA